MLSRVAGASLFLSLLSVQASHSAQPAPDLVFHPSPGEAYDTSTQNRIDAFLKSLSPLQGDIALYEPHAHLTIPKTHYFLSEDDALAVMDGKPGAQGIIGLIYPIDISPLDYNALGAAVYYNDDGYISDEAADSIDYNAVMRTIRASEQKINGRMAENKYEFIETLGWAVKPSYNKDTHKLQWAKRIRFNNIGSEAITYEIDILGRRGALAITYLAEEEQLAAIQLSAPAVMQMAEFDPGSRYEDYKPGQDKKATYGIAGLIGGLAIANKVGLLSTVAVLVEKFFLFILAGFAAFFTVLRRFLTHRSHTHT